MEKEIKKPKAKIIGENGNVFNLGAICVAALEKAKMPEQAAEMRGRIMRSKSYDEAIQIMGEYCNLC